MLLSTTTYLYALASAAEATPTGLVDLAQYGVLGIVAVGLIVFARNAHKREQDRADRMEAENRRLNELLLERVIPALTSATHAAKQSADLLQAMQEERQYSRRPRGGGS